MNMLFDPLKFERLRFSYLLDDTEPIPSQPGVKYTPIYTMEETDWNIANNQTLYFPIGDPFPVSQIMNKPIEMCGVWGRGNTDDINFTQWGIAMRAIPNVIGYKMLTTISQLRTTSLGTQVVVWSKLVSPNLLYTFLGGHGFQLYSGYSRTNWTIPLVHNLSEFLAQGLNTQIQLYFYITDQRANEDRLPINIKGFKVGMYEFT